MKKLMFSLLVAMIMVFCTGCAPINPPNPPIIKKYTLTAVCISYDSFLNHGSISPATMEVKSGDNATFNIVPDDGYTIDVIKDNGAVVSLSSLASYTLSNVTADHVIEVTFKVKEGSPLDYLTKSPWYQCYMLSLQPDGSWGEYTKNSGIFKYNFYINKNFEFFKDDQLVGWGTWSLETKTNPMSLNYGGVNFKIEKLTSDSLIYIQSGIPELDGTMGSVKAFNSHVKN